MIQPSVHKCDIGIGPPGIEARRPGIVMLWMWPIASTASRAQRSAAGLVVFLKNLPQIVIHVTSFWREAG
jgi:hypothetical protein